MKPITRSTEEVFTKILDERTKDLNTKLDEISSKMNAKPKEEKIEEIIKKMKDKVPERIVKHEEPVKEPVKIEPVKEKLQYEIRWPNIIRINHSSKPTLKLDIEKVKPIELNAYDTAKLVEMAPIIDGKPDITKISEIDLEDLGKKFRLQKIIFETARDIYDQMKPTWSGNKEFLLAQLIRIVEQFIASNKIIINPPLFYQEEIRRRILILLNMSKTVQHIWEEIRCENTESLEPIFDSDNPIRSTGDMRTWYTGKACAHTKRSHINFCVFDSTWEASESFELDRNPNISAWVKNDHLGFEVLYVFEGIVHKYRPDFIIRLKTGDYLVLEIKGQDAPKDKTKRNFLDEWVRAVNAHGGFGKWQWAVSKDPADVAGIIEKSVEQ